MTDYTELVSQAESLVDGEPDRIANTANVTALVYHTLPQVNWVGVYLFDGTELVVGPFQGRPACVRIPIGRGVCGTAADQRETLRIADVHAFDGHIACDPVSRSEIVVPLVHDGQLLGVLDLDSPELDRFDESDQRGLEDVARILTSVLR